MQMMKYNADDIKLKIYQREDINFHMVSRIRAQYFSSDIYP